MSAHGKPKEEGQSEQLNKLLAMEKIGQGEQKQDQSTTMNTGRGRQYEAVLKHRSDGLLGREFFDDPDMAKRWLFRRWAGLCVPLSVVDSHCAGAIYDQHDSQKRIFTIGAAYLVDEDRGDKGA